MLNPTPSKMGERSTDEQMLHRALELARKGIGLASPNPYVGAVIVDAHSNIAGMGTYTYDGVKHAEILALDQAGDKARGGTLYINLEPHAHHGRTPPCTDALFAAGVRRVVACMPDPNPKVSGLGFQKLRSAGLQVEVGQLEAEARRLNEAFARHIRYGLPLVTLKAALTLDGKIALPTGKTTQGTAGIPPGGWITGEVSRAHVQQQRHQSDAIMVGIGTILADDPLLTDRSGTPRRRPLLRVILDSHLRLPLESRLVRSVEDTGQSDVLVFCSSGEEKAKRELEARGIRVEQLAPAASDHRPDMHEILRRLGQFDITSVMIEGGAKVNGVALDLGVVDKVFLYYAPKILGNQESLPLTAGTGSRSPQEIPRITHLQVHRFGEDFAVEGYLCEPYAE